MTKILPYAIINLYNYVIMVGDYMLDTKYRQNTGKTYNPELVKSTDERLLPLITVEEATKPFAYLFFKRVQDVFFSLLAIIVLMPVLLIVALVIFIDDPKGSPIFVQVRCGKMGKPFKMYKFRSMRVGAEQGLEYLLKDNEMDGPVFKIKDDPRITKVGKFIRKTSIDELPQLFNILIGDMSIVGPRPALPREVEQYGEYEAQRLFVTPGLTCYWQIQPSRNDISFMDWVKLDIRYINERSFWTDWKIIFRTVITVFSADGE